MTLARRGKPMSRNPPSGSGTPDKYGFPDMAFSKIRDETGKSRFAVLRSVIENSLRVLIGGSVAKPQGQVLPSLAFVCDGPGQVAACIALADARRIPYAIVFPSDYRARIIAQRSPRTFDHLELEMEFAGELVIAVAEPCRQSLRLPL
jgi:hypothetical protein